MAMIEAMAFGTPIVAMRNGSVPEVVDEGVTGFIVASDAEAAAAAVRLTELDRMRIRKVFEERFTARRMAKDYVALYRRPIGERDRLRVGKRKEGRSDGMAARTQTTERAGGSQLLADQFHGT